MPVSRKHIHKYHKISLAGVKVWACALPNCNHYMPKHMEEMVHGRFAICTRCDDQYILEKHRLKMDEPICELCEDTLANKASRPAVSEDDAKAALDRLMQGLRK